MTFVLDTIEHGLSNFANFEGRDRRRTFWFLVLIWLPCFFATYVLLWSLFFDAPYSRYLDGLSVEDQTTGDFLQRYYFVFAWLLLVYASLIGPLASTAVRRLNDTGVGAKPLKRFAICHGVILTLFALFPIALLVTEDPEQSAPIWITVTLITGFTTSLVATFYATYLGIYLIVHFLKKGDPEPNRFGPPPED